MLSSAIADHLHVVPGVSTRLCGETRKKKRTGGEVFLRSLGARAQFFGAVSSFGRGRSPRAWRADSRSRRVRPCLCGFCEPCGRLRSWGGCFRKPQEPAAGPVFAHPLGRFNVLIPGFLQLASHKHPRRTVFFQKPWAVSTFLGRVLGFLLIFIQIIKYFFLSKSSTSTQAPERSVA